MLGNIERFLRQIQLVANGFNAMVGSCRTLYQHLFVQDQWIGKQKTVFDFVGDRNVLGDQIAGLLVQHPVAL